AVGGIPELTGSAAVLVPPGDVDALDAAVQRLLDDPAAREHYAQAGRAQAATWPTPEQTLAQVRDVYAELTGLPAAGAWPLAYVGWCRTCWSVCWRWPRSPASPPGRTAPVRRPWPIRSSWPARWVCAGTT